MMSKISYQRPQAAELRKRLNEPRRCIQVVAGPRQVGKTTLVLAVTEGLERPVVYASADEPALRMGEEGMPLEEFLSTPVEALL